MTIAGTRREAIKLAPLMRLLARRPHVRHRLLATGQHGAAMHRALADFGLEADGDLGLPVEGDPAIADPLRAAVDGTAGIHLEPRLAYSELIRVMGRAHVLLTDSGTVQESASALGLPVLLLHDFTDRPELVASGNVRLVGRDPDRILDETQRLLDVPLQHAAMARPAFPYGRGDAARRIFEAIEQWADLPAPIPFEPLSYR